MTKLTHTDSQGNARMVDVTDKQVQLRVAKASGHIQLSAGTLQYYYMLDGFDKDWYNVENQKRVTYSNLSRGTYVFKVKAKNRAGEWAKNQAELVIHVKPAPWFSYLAWTIYNLFIASIIFIFFRLRMKTFIYKKNLENEHFEHLREREINWMK